MNDFVLNNIYLIILLPLFVSIFIPLFNLTGMMLPRKIVIGSTLISTFTCIIFAVVALLTCLKNPHFMLENSYSWLDFSHVGIKIGIGTFVDNLSSFLIFIVSTVSFLVQLFSVGYMKDDKGFNRFFALLNFFNFAMLGLALSSNLVQTYIFWELVGVASYLLIGFWFERKAASNAAKKAFLVNRVGDVCLLFGIIALIYFSYNFDISQGFNLLSYVNIHSGANVVYWLAGGSTFFVICLLLLIGSIAKSAQFPLYVWLEDAMQGPTPVSALIHAATMVAAGVFLIARLYPLYTLSPEILKVVAFVGLFTAFFGAIIALVQNDIKKLLAFSTCSQLGLMFFALGIGAYSGGLFHLMTHAYFKALLFLAAGLVLIVTSHQQDIKLLGGLRNHSPLSAFAFGLGALSLSGAFFSGYLSKEMIYSFTFNNLSICFFISLLILTFLTSLYIFKSYFLIFEGKSRSQIEYKKTSSSMNTSVIFLSLFVIGIGFIFANRIENLLFIEWNNLTNLTSQTTHNLIVPILSLVSSLLGILVAYLFYKTDYFLKIEPSRNLLWKIVYNKFYFETCWSFIIKNLFYPISKGLSWFDKNIIDGAIRFLGYATIKTSQFVSLMQSGNIQAYISCAIFVIGLFLIALVWVYYWMMKV